MEVRSAAVSREDAGGRVGAAATEEHGSLSPGQSGKKNKEGLSVESRRFFGRAGKVDRRSQPSAARVAICEKRASGDATAAAGVRRRAGRGAGRTPTAVQRCKYLAANFRSSRALRDRARGGEGGG